MKMPRHHGNMDNKSNFNKKIIYSATILNEMAFIMI